MLSFIVSHISSIAVGLVVGWHVPNPPYVSALVNKVLGRVAIYVSKNAGVVAKQVVDGVVTDITAQVASKVDAAVTNVTENPGTNQPVSTAVTPAATTVTDPVVSTGPSTVVTSPVSTSSTSVVDPVAPAVIATPVADSTDTTTTVVPAKTSKPEWVNEIKTDRTNI